MESTAKPGSARDLLLLGLVLALIGGAALISELVPDFDRYLPLLVGLGLLVVFAVGRSYLALVAGGVLTGLGTGLLAAQLFPSSDADGVGSVLGLGGGFIGVWLVSAMLNLKERHWWPLVPGTILGLVGAGMLLEAGSQPLLLPIVLLVFGGALMLLAYVRLHRPQAQGRT